MNKRIYLIAIVATISSVAHAGSGAELADAYNTIHSIMINISPELLKTCVFGNLPGSPLPADAIIKSCSAGDIPGQGLVCPPVSAAQIVKQPINCDIASGLEVGVNLSSTAKASLDFDHSMQVVAKIFGDSVSIGEHSHHPNGSDYDCSDPYLQNKVTLTFLSSIYQKASVSATIPTDAAGVTSFTAKVTAAGYRADSWGGQTTCLWRKHVGDSSCSGE